MRIGVDARVLAHRPTGVARYLRGVLRHARAMLAPDDALTLYADAPMPTADRAAGRPCTLTWPLPGGDMAWRQLRLPPAIARDAPDVLFCPFYSVPLASSVRRVVTIHDVAFDAHPEWFDWKGRIAFRLAGPSARRAARVLTPSAFSAGEVMRLYGIPASRVEVTPLGVDAAWSEPPSANERHILRDWLGFDGPFVLHLGAVHMRRLPDVLVDAFALLAPRFPDLRLVVAGPTIAPAQDLSARARERGVVSRFVRMRWVPEEHLRTLVAEARAVVYLSLYEGFGLPALEAMAAGTPVVVLRRASLPEVCGDAALWVEEPEPRQVADALALVLDDERVHAERALAGRTRAKGFTWERTAALTWAAIKAAASGSP